MNMKQSIISWLAGLAVLAGSVSGAPAGLKVVSMHPLLTDLARQVGGSQVEVSGLMAPGEDIHRFSSSSSDMAKAAAADVILVSGKGLESYLPKLSKSLPESVRVVQAGNAVRSIKVSASSSLFVCCPAHSAGSIDPHWWHSISGMKKAAVYVGKEFGKADPGGAAGYEANAEAYGNRLDELAGWAKQQVAKVPRSRRVLVTAHAAYAYFCQEFGFRSVPVAGLSGESVSSKYLAETIGQIREHKVTAVFPEENADQKALDAIISATGVNKGGLLIADGSAHGVTTYEAFIRHNIGVVVKSLGN